MFKELNGIVKDLFIDEYHAYPGISSSGINLIKDCPKRFWYERISENYVRKEKACFSIGSLVHTLCLEPDSFTDRYLVLPSISRTTKEGKEQYKISLDSGKNLVKPQELEEARLMSDSILSNKSFSSLMKVGNVEDSIFYKNEDGITIKSRPDFYNDFLVLDLKTTKSVNPQSFQRSIIEYGYHRQAAMALDLLSAVTGRKYETFIIMAVEKTAPYLNCMYLMSEELISRGRQEYLESVEVYKTCLKNNYWPGYQDDIQEISLPTWY